MRLRTAAGLALASLCAVAAVMHAEGPRTEARALDAPVLVIGHDALTTWDCPQDTAEQDR